MTVDGLLLEESIMEIGGRVAGDRGIEDRSVEDGASFLTVAEVASRMRVSKMTVYRLVHSGELPAKRFGRTFHLHRSSVEELIEAARYLNE